MVNTNHRELTGVALHEAKGTAAATIGQVFVADGAGSGSYSNVANPAGTVIMFATDAVPAGYLECDGSSVSTTTQAVLFAVIAYEFGGSGANFNLPDLRGQFIRGYDNGAGIDLDAASRTDRGDATTGDQVGTKQAQSTEDHTHSTTLNVADNLESSGGSQKTAYKPSESAMPTASTNPGATKAEVSGSPSTGADNETRPVNITMMFCIKT